jgi:hypothetical protein
MAITGGDVTVGLVKSDSASPTISRAWVAEMPRIEIIQAHAIEAADPY